MNSILQAFRGNVASPDPDMGEHDFKSVLRSWTYYMETGNQEVSSDPDEIRVATKVLRRLTRVQRCVCVEHSDGSVTRFLCPVHADSDPCLTMAQATGNRRRGSIRRGVCSNCGWGGYA
jgi:hypothetical protein